MNLLSVICYGNRFVWLMVDIGSETYLMESQHLIVASSNHEITWYKVTNVDKETIQVSSVWSLTAAHMSSVSMKGDDCYGNRVIYHRIFHR